MCGPKRVVGGLDVSAGVGDMMGVETGVGVENGVGVVVDGGEGVTWSLLAVVTEGASGVGVSG